MSKMTRVALLVTMIIGALASYSIGIKAGAIGFVMLGCLLELCFWLGLFSSSDEEG